MEHIRSTGPGRILVIERDPAVSRFVEFVLGNWEAFDVTSVSEAALALAGSRPSPGTWSWSTTSCPARTARTPWGCWPASREIEPRLPVAMMTAFPVTGPTADSLRAADGHVTKPLVPSHLIGLATGLIERFRRAREEAGGC